MGCSTARGDAGSGDFECCARHSQPTLRDRRRAAPPGASRSAVTAPRRSPPPGAAGAKTPPPRRRSARDALRPL